MKPAVLLLALLFALVGVTMNAQDDPLSRRLPNGKVWRDELHRAEYESNLKDARDLAELTAEIEADLQSIDGNVLPLKTLKKLDHAETLLKNLRNRLKQN